MNERQQQLLRHDGACEGTVRIAAHDDEVGLDPLHRGGEPHEQPCPWCDGSGVFQQFDGGVLIYKNGGPVYFVWGKIRDQWNKLDASQGKLGYPTSDEQILPDGSFKSVFEHGTVTFKTGDPDATVTLN